MDIGNLSLDDIVILIIGVLAALLILRLIFGSIRKIIGLVINGLFGAVLLLIVNYFGAYFGITIGINLLTALIAGILGIPGVVLMVLFQIFIA